MKLTGNNLIIVNILATYGRILFVAGLMIFSSRWVLNALGEEDYGLYSLVGGLIVFIVFIRMVTANSSQRFFAYAIGQGNNEEVRKWFNFSFFIHLMLGVSIALIGIPVGIYLIDNVLKIPPNRVPVCHFVYYLSVIAAVVTSITTPGYAMLVAKQRLFELALWETLRGVSVFFLSWYILYSQGDLLLLYSTGVVSISVFTCFIQYVRAYILFSECRINIRYWFDKEKVKEFFGFSWWLSFAALCLTIRNQGVMILINIYYGAKVNAALGIANQVSSQASSLSSAIYSAVAPEMTASEGSGNRKRVEMLAIRTSKFITLLTLFWFIPFFTEMEYVLELWLKEVPDYTVAFCRIILIAAFIDKITVGQVGAMHSIGKIGRFEGSVGILYVLSLPITWWALKYGYSPKIALSSIILMGFFITYGRLFWLKKLMNIGFYVWFKEVLLKGGAASLLSVIFVIMMFYYFDQSFIRLLLNTIGCTIFTAIGSVVFSLTIEEKSFFLLKIKRIIYFNS